jgi:hypothetical protein
MYTHTLHIQIAGAERAQTEPIERYGIKVYVESDPDYVGSDFKIEPGDEKGIAIFREFAAKMHEHYKSLQDGAGSKA